MAEKEILSYLDLLYLHFLLVKCFILIGEKPFDIKVLEEEQQELNENLIVFLRY